jgi:hypothetical protein
MPYPTARTLGRAYSSERMAPSASLRASRRRPCRFRNAVPGGKLLQTPLCCWFATDSQHHTPTIACLCVGWQRREETERWDRSDALRRAIQARVGDASPGGRGCGHISCAGR